jgi:hypothetical protein
VKDENIIGINVANGVSILIMGAFGALILAAIRHAVTGSGNAKVSAGPRDPGT